MKRIVCLLILILTLLLSSTCIAFRDPDPNKWSVLGRSEKQDIWIHNNEFSRFENNNNSPYNPHFKHVFYSFWSLVQNKDKKEELLNRTLCQGHF